VDVEASGTSETARRLGERQRERVVDHVGPGQRREFAHAKRALEASVESGGRARIVRVFVLRFGEKTSAPKPGEHA
jgi:hypothetical protein